MSGFMPQAAFAAVVVIVAAAAAVNGAKVTGRLDASQGGRDAWQLWQECLGLFGLVLLPQARTAHYPFGHARRACAPGPGLTSCADLLQLGVHPLHNSSSRAHEKCGRRLASQTSQPVQL